MSEDWTQRCYAAADINVPFANQWLVIINKRFIQRTGAIFVVYLLDDVHRECSSSMTDISGWDTECGEVWRAAETHSHNTKAKRTWKENRINATI
jgi:hypothetical protein